MKPGPCELINSLAVLTKVSIIAASSNDTTSASDIFTLELLAIIIAFMNVPSAHPSLNSFNDLNNTESKDFCIPTLFIKNSKSPS